MKTDCTSPTPGTEYLCQADPGGKSARTYASRHLGDTDLTLTQFAVLEAWSAHHLGPMSLSDIARKILTTGGNLTMVVGNLEKQGLAQRQRCPEDRRLSIIVLSPKGKTLMREIFPRHAAAYHLSSSRRWAPRNRN